MNTAGCSSTDRANSESLFEAFGDSFRGSSSTLFAALLIFNNALVADPVFCVCGAIGARSLLAISSYAVRSFMISIGFGVSSVWMILSRNSVASLSSLSICASLAALDMTATSLCDPAAALTAAELDCDAGACCLVENADWLIENWRKLLVVVRMRRDRGGVAGRVVMNEQSWQTGASALRIVFDLICTVWSSRR